MALRTPARRVKKILYRKNYINITIMRFLAKVVKGSFKPLQKLNIPEGTVIELEINTRKWFEEIIKETENLIKLPGRFFPDFLIDRLFTEYLHIAKRVRSSRKECKDAVALFLACRRLGIPCKIKKISYRSLRKLLKERAFLSITHYLDFILRSLRIDNVLSEQEIIDALKKVDGHKSLTTLGAVLYILANRKGGSPDAKKD